MSHFRVLVIGPSVADQLAKYDENLKTDDCDDDDLNPNAKWDWYEIGGRYTGYLKLKEGTTGECGEPGLLTPPAKLGWVDSTELKNIDIEGMRNVAGRKAEIRYDLLLTLTNGEGIKAPSISWEEFCDNKDLTWDERRELYAKQPEVVAFKAMRDKAIIAWKEAGEPEGSPLDWLAWETDIMRLAMTKEQYVKAAKDSAFTAFAIVKDGQWYERGEMGWFACVSNEKDRDTWNEGFAKLISGLDPETCITVVDCHI